MTVETVLLFALAAVAVTVLVRWVADRTGMPAAALLTIVGIGYALLPGPNITLEPDVVLTFVLPPLLYSAALDSSLLAIRRNLRTVVSLAVVLVLVTALAIGVAFEVFVAGATLATGIAVGAAVAPTTQSFDAAIRGDGWRTCRAPLRQHVDGSAWHLPGS